MTHSTPQITELPKAVTAFLASDAARAFSYTKTLTSAQQLGAVIEVTERLEGDFPGGRVDLRSSFTLGRNGLIESLTIAAAD